MNEEKDKNLDDLFKRKLEDPGDHIGYREDDWKAFEQLLDKPGKRRGVVYWLPYIGSAAALLLLFLGYWAFRPKAVSGNSHNNQLVINHIKPNTGTNGGSIRQLTDHSPKTLSPVVIAATVNSNKNKGNHTSFLPLSAGGARRTAGYTGYETPVVVSGQAYSRPGEALSAVNPVTDFGTEQIVAQPINATNILNKSTATGIRPDKQNISKIKRLAYHPQFALSILAAPDVNGVGSSFQQGKVGTNEGLLFSAGISKKFTITTGAIYSDKPYITGFANYHTGYQFGVNPVDVTADCRMLDIPLNIGYQVYNKHQNKISVGTGLSSYIMLSQTFQFNYSSAYNTGPAQFNAPGVDKYFFGVLNLNATYQHQVNSKVGYSIQPYMKLPLTNIGYSQVKLQTTGVAIGLTWNINSLPKP
jgi:hypothetical protein